MASVDLGARRIIKTKKDYKIHVTFRLLSAES
jgi:hypothetical protein